MSADATATRSVTHSPGQLECTAMEIQDPADFNAEPMPDKISAYYSLVFNNYTYYLQTTSVTIGRRAVRNGAGASTSDTTQADVDLGALKSVSRLHARIDYEEESERYVLVILGRNGAWVDGVWSGSGSRVPLGARSQIQIASRIFHFILPPAPPPEDSPSPSSPGSSTRQLSPSIDITSLSPASSPPSPLTSSRKLPVTKPEPTEPLIPPVNGKKRKKPDPEARKPVPVPEVMPPRPSFTYAQLCNRAIKDLGGKATLQDICHWISDNHDWYRYNEGKTGWESSVRHNLSSNRAFKKLEKSVGERGKGFLWSVDPNFEHLLKEHPSKAPWAVNGGVVDNGKSKGKAKAGKNGVPIESPLKRSVKGEPNSPLPPPLTSTPLPPFTTQLSSTLSQASSVLSTSDPTSVSSTSTPLTITTAKEPPSSIPATTAITPPSIASSTPQPQATAASQSIPGSTPPNLQDIKVPIVLDATPFTSTDVSESASGDALTSHFKTSPIALRGDKIALNPAIFGDLTPNQLRELESLGTKKAIEILQGYIVKFLKERIKAEGAKGKGKTKGKNKSKSKKDKGKEGESQKEKSESIAPDGVESTVGNAGKQEKVAQRRDSNNNVAGVSGSASVSRSRKIDTSVGPFTTVPLPPRAALSVPAAAPTSMTVNGPSTSAPQFSIPNYAPMPNPYLHPYSYATLSTTPYVGTPPTSSAPVGDSKLVPAAAPNTTAETNLPTAASPPPKSNSPPPMSQLAEEDGSSGDFIDIENDEPDMTLPADNEQDNDGPAQKRRRVGEVTGVPVAVV